MAPDPSKGEGVVAIKSAMNGRKVAARASLPHSPPLSPPLPHSPLLSPDLEGEGVVAEAQVLGGDEAAEEDVDPLAHAKRHRHHAVRAGDAWWGRGVESGGESPGVPGEVGERGWVRHREG